MKSLKAFLPNLSFHTASTGTSFYIQQRTSLFARVALICGLIGLGVRLLADFSGGKHGPPPTGVYVALVVSNVSSFALWLFTRGKPLPLKFVRGVELVTIPLGLVAMAIGFRLAQPGLIGSATTFGRANPTFMVASDPGIFRGFLELTGLLTALLVATQILALRAALVPSTVRHSLFLAALVGFPITITSGLALPPMLPPEIPFAEPDRGFIVGFGTSWWLFTGAVCAIISKVVHRLQSEIQVAKRLGQYELGERLGEGGMGVVYRGKHAMMKRPVAVKLLPLEAAGQEAITRFEREVILTSQLSHPNTVVIHDYGRTNEGVFYYVMEFIDGATLEKVVKTTGPMPSGRVANVIAMVAGSLGEAHEHGLVHRDVKPANILLGPRGGEPDVAKVLDFGLVRTTQPSVELTNAKIVMGTPLFMSPEAIRTPDRVDARSDLYSLGAVAYYLLSGRYLFEAENAVEVCAKHLHAEPRPLSELVPGIDPDLEQIVRSCVAKDPAKRPSSARELCEALQGCASYRTWNRSIAKRWWEDHRSLLPGG